MKAQLNKSKKRQFRSFFFLNAQGTVTIFGRGRYFAFFFFLGSSRRHALHSRCVAAASVIVAIVFVIVAVDQEKQHQQQQSGTAAAAVVSTDVLRRRRRFFLDIGPPAPAPGTPLESPPTGPALRHHHAALLREYDVKFQG